MKSITCYLNSLDGASQQDFARRCGTTVGYLRKAVSINQKISEGLCIALERESQQAIRCDQIRPDVDWQYLRSPVSTLPAQPVVTQEGQGATHG